MSKEKIVGLASGSPRRKAALEQIPDIKIINVGGGEEAETADLVNIALCKIAFAYPTILDNCREISSALFGVVAADTNTLIGIIENGRNHLESKGKPQNYDVTMQHFSRMSDRAKSVGFGYYEATAASAFQGDVGTTSELRTTRVVLNKDKIANLASTSGFQEYLELFNAFYRSRAYSSSGLSPVQPTDLSAGISLPVLVKMGAVEMINGTELKKEKAKKLELVLKQALLNVAVGFSPKILEKIHPDAISYLIGWSWTNQVVEEMLSK